MLESLFVFAIKVSKNHIAKHWSSAQYLTPRTHKRTRILEELAIGEQSREEHGINTHIYAPRLIAAGFGPASPKLTIREAVDPA
jgi:hypothetical protein